MAHAQKPDLVFQRKGRVHLNLRVGQLSTTGSRGVHIRGSNGSNAGYTVFWGIARSKPDGTRWHTVGEVKRKDVNGVGSQQPCTVRWNMVYPALLPTIKTCDKLASSTVSRELRSKIRQFQNDCFHITLNYCWHSEFSCFLCYDIWYTIYWSTAIVLTHGGSSTVHIYTQKCGPCPVFVSFTLAFALQLRIKQGKTSVRVAKEC
jgi:hypothetical protein